MSKPFTIDNDRYLIISDLQIPFHHKRALEFCIYLKSHFKIPDENVYNVGDELDCYWGGLWEKSVEASHTPNSELEESVDELKRWYSAFPKMKLCLSNHGSRWMRKASAAQIPQVMLRRYEDIIEAPDGWEWKKNWVVESKKRFMVEHGDDWGGQFPHKNAAIHNSISTVVGHHHSIASISHIKTVGIDVYGFATGSLIDFDAYAFQYARRFKFKPCIGTGVILDGGHLPIWIPLK